MSSNAVHSELRIGILGTGQLARMLLEACASWKLDVALLGEVKGAAFGDQKTDFLIPGDITDYQTVLDFGKDRDLISVEIENVNIKALKELESHGVKVYPKPETLEMIQDKGLQKQFYQKYGFPTSPFTLGEGPKSVQKFPMVQKVRRGGYDGRGVKILKSPEDLYSMLVGPSVFEEKVNIEKEISVIVARNARGEKECFPVVEMVVNPQLNLLDYLLSPAEVSPQVQEKARDLALNIAEKCDLVGLLAVEMFLSTDGEVIVNEVAPRPHNSGHHTIEATSVSQFEQFWRAILNAPLIHPEEKQIALCRNLLGEENELGPAIIHGLKEAQALGDVHVHYYEKGETRPGRKMGHVTILASTKKEALQKMQKVQSWLKIKAQ